MKLRRFLASLALLLAVPAPHLHAAVPPTPPEAKGLTPEEYAAATAKAQPAQ